MGMFDDLIPTAGAGPAGGGMFDDLIPTAPPAKPLGTLDYLTRKLTQGASGVMQGGAILGGGLAGAVGANDLRDRAFDTAVNFGKFSKDTDIGTGTNDAAQSMPQRVGGAVVQALPMLAAAVVNPALALAPMGAQSMGVTGDLVSEGVDAGTAGKVFAADMAGNTVGMLPFVGPALGPMGSKLIQKIGTGALANVAQGAGTDYAKQSILADNYAEQAKQFDPANVEARIVDALIGGGTGVHAHYSPEARQQRQAQRDVAAGQAQIEASRVAQEAKASADAQAAQLATDLQTYGPILEANGIDPNSTRAQGVIANLKAREAAKAQTQAEAQAETVPPSPEQIALAQRQQPPAVIPVDSAGRADAGDQTIGVKASMLDQGGDAALQDKQAGQAFDIADRRQRQADADLANNGQIDPDYQGGGAAARGGAFDAGIRRVTLLDGELPVTLMENDGKKATVAIEQNGKQILVEVDPKRITEHDLPANQRMAQDFNARSDTPPTGSWKGGPKAAKTRTGEGVGIDTMASENMPRRSTDRIAGDQYGGRATPYNPNPLDGGRVSGDVLPPDAGTSVVPGGRRAGDTVEGTAARPTAGFDAPNEQRQIGAPPRQIGERSRFATDEQGRTVDRENRQPLAGEGQPMVRQQTEQTEQTTNDKRTNEQIQKATEAVKAKAQGQEQPAADVGITASEKLDQIQARMASRQTPNEAARANEAPINPEPKGAADGQVQKATQEVLKPGKPLNTIDVKVEAVVAETGAKVKLSEKADVALADVDNRLTLARRLLECLAS
jgi:hypothetical protein